MANGKIIYYAADGTPTTYIFEDNFNFDYERSHVPTADVSRTLSTALRGYGGGKKLRFVLPFTFVSEAQLLALEAAWGTCRGVDFYLDASAPEKTITGMIMDPPSAKAKGALKDGAWTYSFDLVIEEI